MIGGERLNTFFLILKKEQVKQLVKERGMGAVPIRTLFLRFELGEWAVLTRPSVLLKPPF